MQPYQMKFRVLITYNDFAMSLNQDPHVARMSLNACSIMIRIVSACMRLIKDQRKASSIVFFTGNFSSSFQETQWTIA